MKKFTAFVLFGAAMASLAGCSTTYSQHGNHYCSSNEWNGTHCVSTNNHSVQPVVVRQPVVVHQPVVVR